MNSPTKQKTIESLIHVLQTGNDANRCFSAQALGNISEPYGDTQAVRPLLAALHDEDEDVVMDAAAALGQIGNDAAASDLMECYRNHPVGDVKVAVVEALGKIAQNMETDRQAVIEFLQEAVAGRGEDSQWESDDEEWDDWWDAQFKAIEALGNLRVSQAVPVILAALDDEEAQELNEAVFRALAKMGEAGESALIERLTSGDTTQRRYAAKHLARVHTEKSRAALSSALRDADVPVCVAAANSLVSQLTADVSAESIGRTALLNAFQDSRVEVRRRVLEVSAKADFSIPRELLKKLLKDDEETVRIQTLRTIAEQKNKDLSKNVFATLRNQSLQVVTEAVRTLGELDVREAAGTSGAGSTIAALLTEQGLNTELRVQSAVALGKIGGATELPALLEMLKDSEQPVRLNSLNAIARLEFPEKQEVLLAALRGELLAEDETPAAESQGQQESLPENRESEDAEPQEIPQPQSTLEAIMSPTTETTQTGSENESPELTEEQQHFLKIAEANSKLNQELQDRKILAPHQDIKRFAAAVLGERKVRYGMQKPKIVSGLTAALSDSEPLVQQTAAESLGRIADSTATEALAALLISEEKPEAPPAEVRLKTASALGKMALPEAVAALSKHFPDEKDLFVRIQILQSLAESAKVFVKPVSTDEQQTQLKNLALLLLEDTEAGIRKAAAELLLAIQEKTGESSVISAIAHSAFIAGGEQRLEVGRSLRKANPETGSAVFLATLATPEQENRHRVAIEALQEIHRL